jgi:hypothetical protein
MTSISDFSNYKSIKVYDADDNYFFISKLRLGDSSPFNYALEVKNNKIYYDMSTKQINTSDISKLYGQIFDQPIESMILEKVSQLFDL